MNINAKRRIVIIAIIFLLGILTTGCVNTVTTSVVYTGLTVSGEIEKGYQKADLSKIESLLGQKLPLPIYLPDNYQIKESYYYQEPNSTPQVTDILLLISDQPISWSGSQYTCRIALFIGWNEPGFGFKGVVGGNVPNINEGKLEQNNNEYILWWESYGSLDSLGSTLKLFANQQFSKDELINIAASTPANTSLPSTTSASPTTTESINYRTVQIVFMSQQKADDTTSDMTPLGTGIIVNNNGYVITANHLIDAGEQYIQQSQAEIKKLGILIPFSPTIPEGNLPAQPQQVNDFDVIARDENHDLALLKIKMAQSSTPEGQLESVVFYSEGASGTLDISDAPFTTNISRDSPIAITGYISAQLTLATKTGKVTSEQIPGINNSLISVATGNFTYYVADYYQTDIASNSIFSGSPVYSISNMAIMGICISTSQDEFDNSGEIYIIPSVYVLDLLKNNNIK